MTGYLPIRYRLTVVFRELLKTTITDLEQTDYCLNTHCNRCQYREQYRGCKKPIF